MHRRRKRDFLPHGIDNSFEINFAHSHAPLRQSGILPPGR
jgi:hypothetical protein